jgi:tripartite-type tricarboxylate transporter receptor subunit TctC
MKRILTAAALATTLAFSASATAQDYPNRPIRMIVPFPAGQASDTISRLVGEELAKALGQPVVVENRPGAGGNVGSEAGARAAPDGYTLTVATAALPISRHVRRLNFDPAKDFAPVTLMTITPLVMIARNDLPANSVREVIAYGKANPGKLTFASSGVGTSHHLSGELFKSLAGIDMLHVPYQGSPQAHVDLLGGRVDVMFDNIVPVTPHITQGRLKPLAVTTPQRAKSQPNIPTMAEAGMPDFEAVAWFGLLAPAATPAPIVERLNREVTAILKRPEISERLAAMGAIVVGNSPAEFGRFMQAEIDKWGPVVQRANIKVD